jgi:molybdopterin molybdotransferase
VISVEEALERVLHSIDVLEDERKPLLDCLGQVLAEDVCAPFDVPPHDNAAMDGYAVQASSIEGTSLRSPKMLRVIGEVAAGDVSDVKVHSKTAVRIMTGAIVPDGADTVVPFEDTDEVERSQSSAVRTDIGVKTALARGCNIRRRGEAARKGELVIKRGSLLRPAEIGVLAIRRPVVGILATGNEVMEVGKSLLPGKIYNSNSHSLAAQVMRYGGVPKLLGVAPDDVEQLSKSVRSALDCDLLITSGGVSLGDYDVVKEVLAAEGDMAFWTVRMKPGKPLAFGTFRRADGGKIPHFGLPGNPVSSMITFEIFARPAILKMMGRRNLDSPKIKAIMEDSVKNEDGRRIFARVTLNRREGKYYACLTGPQGSGILTSMARANGLAIIPETKKEIKPGTVVEVMILDGDEIGVLCSE